MNKKPKILLVEDDPNFGSVLRDYLIMNGYDVVHAADGAIGLVKFKREPFDLLILDVMMPQKDGFTLAKEIKEINFRQTPFIFLTAKGMKEDMLKGFQIGADDYLTKPFDSEVLLAKIKAIIHRSQPETEETVREFEIGKLKFNAETRELNLGNEVVQLSPKESQLLELFCQDKNRVVSRSKALNLIWKDDNYFTSRSMDVYIAKLRKYMKEDDNLEIINVHGEGFRLVEKSTFGSES